MGSRSRTEPRVAQDSRGYIEKRLHTKDVDSALNSRATETAQCPVHRITVLGA